MWEALEVLVQSLANHPADLLGALAIVGTVAISWKLSSTQGFWKWKEAQLATNTDLTQKTLDLLQEVRQDQIGIRADVREIRNQSKDALDGVNELRPLVDQMESQIVVLKTQLGGLACSNAPHCANRSIDG